ncbi:ChaN family lipoprotein, partial [Campylobacter ureolyticus]
ETISKMVEIQQFKDRRMADKLVHSSKLAILIAGRNHTDKTIGVPLHIIDFNKSKKFSSVGLGYECEEVEIESKNEQDYLIKFNKKENICE